MSIIETFDIIYARLKVWDGDRGSDHKTLVIAAAILSIADVEMKGWSVRRSELKRVKTLAKAKARDETEDEWTR